MTAPIVYVNMRNAEIPQEALEKMSFPGKSVARVRKVYRDAAEDDGTLGGTLWERVAERATLA